MQRKRGWAGMSAPKLAKLLRLALLLVSATAGLWPQLASAQTVTEFLLPSDGRDPRGIAAGPDGALWFAQLQANKIGRMTTMGVYTEFAVPTVNSVPFAITAGPDGSLWFTESAANQIGRITTSGVITEFPISTPNAEPFPIVVEPDAALWFTDRVGTISPISTAPTI